jgi:hypothetical protein
MEWIEVLDSAQDMESRGIEQVLLLPDTEVSETSFNL